MKRSIIIIISLITTIVLLALLGFAYLFFSIGMEPILLRTQQLDQFNGTQTVEIQALDNQNHINGLLIEVKGNISDSLTFTFGVNDSTIYRTEILTPWIVDLNYNGNWYSTLCFLTFEPITDTMDGELQLKYKFYGD